MELVFDLISTHQPTPGLINHKTFRQAGGIIGRAPDCDWVLPDRKRVLSGRHAEISFHEGAFYLTDTSTNGIQCKDSDTRLGKGQPMRIEHGSVFCLGDFEIRARLSQDPASFSHQPVSSSGSDSIIPDDAFLDLDPLTAMDQQDSMYAGDQAYRDLDYSVPETAVGHDFAPLEQERIPVPEFSRPATPPPAAPPPAAPVPPAPPSAAPVQNGGDIWGQFCAALGIEGHHLNAQQQQALALKAAKLLRLSVGCLQHSLFTLNELKTDLELQAAGETDSTRSPLRSHQDSAAALNSLLQPQAPGQPSAEHHLKRGFSELQSHQVALTAASRNALKAMFEHLSPEQLTLRFEQDSGSRISTAGGRWRAYTRLYKAMQSNDGWGKQLYARDFNNAYNEQLRLVASLTIDFQG
ncbi:MAG: type VI secretion system-associated FHA domain protein TagH [Pseudomonadaceae bacterium]|nr:MAG: type VI secretion system-associated FHA domain protein TagH [Pseudomonadaceae bacterium]